MILYHVVTTYQLLHCIVHKERYFGNEKSHIILPDFIKGKYPHYRQLRDYFFDDVLEYPNAKLYRELARDEYLDNINEVFEQVFEASNINLRNYSEIFVAGAQNFIGAYLTINKIDFTMIEEACGVLSRPEILEGISEGLSVSRNRISKDFGLYSGNNPYVKKKICNIDAQKEGFQGQEENLEHFDVVVEMNKLERPFIDKIVSFFGVDKKLEIPSNSMVVLTQHFANIKMMTFEEQIKLYQLVIDYFTQKYNLVFKPHPDDWMYYDTLFPESTLIIDKFPSELIPFVFTQPPEALMTITSTAVASLKTYFQRPIIFSVEFEKNSAVTHNYYFGLSIIADLKFDKLYTIGSDENLLNNLVNFSDIGTSVEIVGQINLNDIPKKSVIIIDDLKDHQHLGSKEVMDYLDSLDDDSVVLFPNSTGKYLFYNYPNKEVFVNMVPVTVEHQDYEDDSTFFETMFFFTKRSEMKSMINSYTAEKKLKHSNKKLSVHQLSTDQMKIKILEGILEATETRLNHYIKLEKELREELTDRK